MKKQILLGVLCLISTLSLAQADSAKMSNYFGVQFGSLGIGGQYVHPIHPRWNLRATGSYFSMSLDQTVEATNYTESRTYNATLGGGALIADFSFLKSTPNWKLAMGAFYQINKVGVNSSYLYKRNGETGDAGTLDLTFTTMPVNPYLGLVWGNFRTKKKVFFTLELGTMFHGTPNVDFTGSGLIEATTLQKPIIEDNVSNYNWFPYANFQINYKLR